MARFEFYRANMRYGMKMRIHQAMASFRGIPFYFKLYLLPGLVCLGISYFLYWWGLRDLFFQNFSDLSLLKIFWGGLAGLAMMGLAAIGIAATGYALGKSLLEMLRGIGYLLRMLITLFYITKYSLMKKAEEISPDLDRYKREHDID